MELLADRNVGGMEGRMKRKNYGESIILRQRCVVLTKLGSFGCIKVLNVV